MKTKRMSHLSIFLMKLREMKQKQTLCVSQRYSQGLFSVYAVSSPWSVALWFAIYWCQWHGKFNVQNARKAGQEELEKGLHGCCLRLLELWWNSDALFDKRPFRNAFILNKNLPGFKYAIFEWFNQSIDNQVVMYSLASVVIIWCGEMLQNNVRLPRNLYCFGLWNASFGSLKWLML